MAGKIFSVKDGILTILNLEEVLFGEIVNIKINDSKSVSALVLNIEENNCSAILLENHKDLKEGLSVFATGNLPFVNVSEEILGRTLNALGEPIDTLPELKFGSSAKKMPLEKIAPKVLERKDVNRPLHTGILAIDSLVPIGRGQRQLIIGDRQTGKTSIAIDAILNQKGEDCICVYVSIGQKASKLAQILRELKNKGAMKYTVIVSATAEELASRQYLSAFTGTAIAEYFAEKGKDVLVVYDDFTKHANAYRQIALLLERPSGREAYPGDIFYLHSKILERSVQYSDEFGGGSITSLPIIETQAGDVSGYIPTNVISITDGQIFLEQSLFNSGQKPAISVGLSVSRVGSTAQTKAVKSVAGGLRLELAQFRELASFAQFGSDLDEFTKKKIDKGRQNMEIIKQTVSNPYSVLEMSVLLFAIKKDLLEKLENTQISNFIKNLKNIIIEENISFDRNQKIEGEVEDKFTKLVKKAINITL